jgi:hypothetical protein
VGAFTNGTVDLGSGARIAAPWVVPTAIASGEAVWIATVLLIVGIATAQVLVAGPREGRLWDSPLTKLLYAYIAAWSLYVFGSAAIETGSAFAIVPLVLVTGLIGLQLFALARDRSST